MNALLLLREFIVHLPLTVDIVTADSSEKNLKDAFLYTTKCTWRWMPWVECIHINRCRGPCILTHEEKTGDSGLSCTSRIFAHYFFLSNNIAWLPIKVMLHSWVWEVLCVLYNPGIQRAIVNGSSCSTRTCFTGRLFYIAAILDLYLNCTDRGSFRWISIL